MKKNRLYTIVLLLLAGLVGFLWSQIRIEPSDNLVTEEGNTMPPEMTIDINQTYTATLKTDVGEIKIQFFADKTPITVNNFVTLARNGFYDGTVFHRVMAGFMIQGGDPDGDGSGGPGYTFNDEIFEGEYKRGVVAMANRGPNTNGSQFFIMHQDYDLPKSYVIFGEVIEGIEVVDKIATAPTQPNASGENSVPATPVIVQAVEITKA